MNVENRHAYLIVAYNNWNILAKQILLLDYFANDIYILVDEKSKDFKEEYIPKCKYSKVYVMDRMKIYWAEYSQVKAMLNMMHAAMENEKKFGISYTYFHFFSGTCLPIKSQKYIHEYCDQCQKEFIGIVPREFWYSTKRVKFYWFFLNSVHYKPHKSVKAFSRVLAWMQKLIGIDRLSKYDGIIYNGWDWASITHDFADYLIDKENMISAMFTKTLCPSELWLHTLAYNSKFKDCLYDVSDLRKGSMRYIDWERGRPYTWGRDSGDFELLMDSPYFFARKFDEKVNMDIVERIFETFYED